MRAKADAPKPCKSNERKELGENCVRRPLASQEECEAALAHTLKDRDEAAYRRTGPFELRRRLMEDCATYLSGEDEVNFR